MPENKTPRKNQKNFLKPGHNNFYHYKNQTLYWGRFNLLKTAKKHLTPFYLYNIKALKTQLKYFKKETSPAKVYYAMKANSHPGILKAFYQEKTGVDVVSGGELKLALKAGFSGQDIVFSGVGKTEEEIRLGIRTPILQFNVESVGELKKIARLSLAMKKKSPCGFSCKP